MLLLDGDTQTKGAHLIEDSGLSSTSGTEAKEMVVLSAWQQSIPQSLGRQWGKTG